MVRLILDTLLVTVYIFHQFTNLLLLARKLRHMPYVLIQIWGRDDIMVNGINASLL